MSGSGQMNLALAIGAAMTATLGADVLWYSLGRYFGTRVLGTLCRFSLDPDSLIREAKERFARHRARYLILAKFLPGVNPLAAGLAGAVPIRPDRFLGYAAAGALAWAGLWITLGYLCADSTPWVEFAHTLASSGGGWCSSRARRARGRDAGSSAMR